MRVNAGTTRFLLVMAAVAGLFCLPRPTSAAPFDNKPKILLHLNAVTTKNACTTWGQLADCQQAVTSGTVASGAAGPFYFMYVLVALGNLQSTGGSGLAGVEFGIEYNNTDKQGVDIFTWNLCATLEFAMTGWPASGTGDLITWDSTSKCQSGEVAVAGYFYCAAYTPDVVKLRKRPVADPNVKVADCASSEVFLSCADIGRANFTAAGTDAGCNPCVAPCPEDCGTAVEPTSWSQIKSLYGSTR